MPISFIEQFMLARNTSTPLIVVRTPDPAATVSAVVNYPDNKQTPMLIWNYAQGLLGVNGNPEPGSVAQPTLGAIIAKQLWQTGTDGKPSPSSLSNPFLMLLEAQKLPRKAVLFMCNLHRYFDDPRIIQAVWNLRDQFKANQRTFIILCPDMTIPPELAQDVTVLDVPLPTPEELAGIVGETYVSANSSGAKIAMPGNDTVQRYVDALAGLSPFAAEQVCAMSIKKDGIDIDQLWERKRQQIEQTPGLSVWRGPQMFKDIGGCENIKKFLKSVMNGKERPRAIVFQDEIEKQLAGAGGDLSGVTQELLGAQLTFMADHDSTGILSVGHPGVAKSDIAKALGNEAEIPTIQLNLGNAKASLIGESNSNMRIILKVIEAVSQGRALWIATANDVSSLPAELRSRYTFGTFFYDLPTPSERNLIWNIYFEKFGLIEDREFYGEKPIDMGWNGREIKNCCLLAYRLHIPIREAANYIIPMYTSASERINQLRRDADGRYISAAYPGPYKAPEGMEEPEPETTVVVGVMQRGKRKIDTGGTPPAGKKSVN